MRLIFSNLRLYLALGACFMFIDAQVSTQTDITTTVENNNTVGDLFRSESTTAEQDHVSTTEPLLDTNAVTELQTKTDLYHAEPTLVNQLSTMLEEPTAVNIIPRNTEQTEQTTTEFAPDQIEQTTMITTYVPPNVETAVAEQITSDAPSTRQYETTVGFTSSEMTSPKKHPTNELTTAADSMSTDSTEGLNPTSMPFQQPADWTASPSNPMETSTITSTATLTSSSQLSQTTPEGHSLSTFDDESDSTESTSVTVSGNVEQSILPIETNWLLIIIVCVTVVCVLCVGMILFVQRRKKNTSGTFGPLYVNGQSKRSKKKKGAGDDAWAGPVNLEAGVECDAEVKEGLLPDDGKKDGDDMVLSTFATLDEGDMSNCGVGGEGTKEAKKWEKQEPLLYIDEDDKAGETLAENQTQKGDDKSEEKELNSGETFCLTTAV